MDDMPVDAWLMQATHMDAMDAKDDVIIDSFVLLSWTPCLWTQSLVGTDGPLLTDLALFGVRC